MDEVNASEWKELLSFLLSQRLELNAIVGAMKAAGILTDEQLRNIRTQAAETAKAWSSKPHDDVLELLRIHSSPFASMTVLPRREK